MIAATEQAIRAHAEQEYPRECCGLVIVRRGREKYIPCRNAGHNQHEHFVIHPEDYAAVEEQGEVMEIVHSHPNIPATPSQADLVGCERSGLAWSILSWPTNHFERITPNGYIAPLAGREFCHGLLDCYSLVKDYYAQVLGLELGQYQREWEWWAKGANLYLDNAFKEGFVRVPNEEMREHDVLLMQTQSDVPNHAAVYLGDGLILHHLFSRLSSRDVYGGYWAKVTHSIYRHETLCNI